MATVRIPVRFQSQLDNRSGQGWRECFTSSAAMLAIYWGAIASDDDFSRIRQRFGDTTEAAAQVRALRALGLQAHFWTNGSRAEIEKEVRMGRPVAVGWLHKGPLSRPHGGHWSVVVGLDGQNHFRMHDPAGEPLLSTGGHRSASSGAAVLCSWAGFLPRWEVEGPATGWFLTCRKP